ncbi:MAG TPA: MCE family protein, partial [Mycobacterium sp.]|nr:MCE family protein [Mycobacterium sp.]
MTAPLNSPRTPPYKLAGFIFVLLFVVIIALVLMQYRGKFEPRTELTVMSDRAGLVMDPGSKVTFNGVEIGRVAEVQQLMVGGEPRAKLTLKVKPKYINLIPQNVEAKIQATTVFGNKYVSFTSPENPSPKRISPNDVIQVSHVTTEFNTLFETLVSIAEKVDPVKLNATLSAAAQALNGLGDRFGQSIIHGNEIFDDVNPQMPQIRYDNQRLADL